MIFYVVVVIAITVCCYLLSLSVNVIGVVANVVIAVTVVVAVPSFPVVTDTVVVVNLLC